MRVRLYLISVAVGLVVWGCTSDDSPGRLADRGTAVITWHLDNLASIGGHELEVSGSPVVIDTPTGKAIEFDGVDDGIFLDVHPLVGLSEFTVEVIFMPYRDGAPEQRFFHMQENRSDDRVMFETRLVDNQSWFLDTFIKSGDQRVTLYADDDLHALGQWHHAAIVVNGNSFEHFVNGQSELREVIRYTAQQSGRMSLGVRLNRVHWFKGAIRTVRVTPRALAPDEFLAAEN
ncbi:MAG: LamG domain-containing protein [Gammaproteobacteria bacterium]|nr:LamG domain-containing protein [Gammaproteobacteria bacterium]